MEQENHHISTARTVGRGIYRGIVEGKGNMEERKRYDAEEWLKKCMKCTHCYKRNTDDEEILCRCRKGCNFKEKKIET